MPAFATPQDLPDPEDALGLISGEGIPFDNPATLIAREGERWRREVAVQFLLSGRAIWREAELFHHALDVIAYYGMTMARAFRRTIGGVQRFGKWTDDGRAWRCTIWVDAVLDLPLTVDQIRERVGLPGVEILNPAEAFDSPMEIDDTFVVPDEARIDPLFCRLRAEFALAFDRYKLGTFPIPKH